MIRLLAIALAISVSAIAACSSSSSTSASTSPDAGSGRSCAVGTITQPDGSCAPADFALACAPGFASDPSGYGCRDVTPDAACTGATRAALGQASCVPVGDCSAPFPPANATLFVSASGSTDATHFKTIGAAVAAATPGAVIAVDSGTYTESVQIAHSVSIIGKCAANVIIDGNDSAIVQGIAVNGANPVSVSGVTIHGMFIGISVEPQGQLTLTHSILDSNYGVGISMEQGNATATLDDVVVRNTQGQDEPGFGINEQASSTLKVSNTEVTGNHDTAIRVSTSSKLTVTSSVISHTTPYPGYAYGRGLTVQGGGTADVSTTAFIANQENAIVITGATATFSQIVVRDTVMQGGAFGRAIDSFDNGNFTLDSSTITDNNDASLIVTNATATISKSVVQGTKLDASGTFGRGVAAQEASQVTISGCALLQNHESGVAAISDSTTLSVTRSFVQGTMFDSDQTTAYGIVGVQGASVTVSNSEIDSCAGAGIAYAQAAGIVSSSVVSNNAIGIATTTDITLAQVDTPPAQVVAGTADVTQDTQFIANQTRSVSGAIPLPSEISQ